MTSDTPRLTGFHDLLPPTAEHEAELAHVMMNHFRRAGYEHVKPPLVEQEQQSDHAIAGHIRKLSFINPASEEVTWLRHDITPQIMRIARTKLNKQTRPLRISYCGECLSTQKSQLHTNRQYLQAGIELFGAQSIRAESDVILCALDSLRQISNQTITIDLNMPTLTQSLLEYHKVEQRERMTLRSILNRKDISSLHDYDKAIATTFTQLLEASGPMEQCLQKLEAIELPQQANKEREQFIDLARHLKKEDPKLVITLDPLENRGLISYIGVTFSLFMEGHGSEIGRGGRYEAHGSDIPQRLFARHHESHHNHLYPHHKKESSKLQKNSPIKEQGEQAVGMTLFIDALAQTIPVREPSMRIFAPLGTKRSLIQKWRAKGAIVLEALEKIDAKNHREQAIAWECSHIIEKEELQDISQKP